MKTSTTRVTKTITMLLLERSAGAVDYTLGIFGNANEDKTTNIQDVMQIEPTILGRERRG
jgi:iron complex transport system substrate-binding protein